MSNWTLYPLVPTKRVFNVGRADSEIIQSGLLPATTLLGGHLT